ncbi:polysaccharide deacetylase family protein [candidate division KSB1 bacterium]|nr:polysaccharide deacetylase family protein [candidate division KSB1 bacterium]
MYRISIILLSILLIFCTLKAQNMAVKMGYQPTDRLLIINADDFGMCHAENIATMALLKDKIINAATAMVPCPWIKEAAEFSKQNPDLDVGIHLTLNNEWKRYKWGTVSSLSLVPSLVTPEGYFPSDVRSVEQNANPEEVRLELKNQIEKGIQLGITPSHLDNHMGSVYGLITGRDFLEIVFDLCAEYQLPFRLPINMDEKLKAQLPPIAVQLFKNRAETALKRGIMLIDYLESTDMKPNYEAFRESVIQQIKALKPGITELYIHPADPTEEIKAISGAWRHREFEAKVFRDPIVQQVMTDEKIISVRWLDLREFQRKGLK